MHKNNWMDFTPLIDVFLILLFVILLNTQIETKKQSQANDAAIEAHHGKINELEVQLEAMQSSMQVQEMEPFEISKYSYLKEKINVVDVSLRTTNNSLWINNEPTDIYLLYGNQHTPDARNTQKTRIKKALMDALQAQKTTDIMTLFTLEEDGNVYRYAFLLVSESIDELIRELGVHQTFLLRKP